LLRQTSRRTAIKLDGTVKAKDQSWKWIGSIRGLD